MFGNSGSLLQTERTPFAPRSPYGVMKLAAHQTTINYRDGFDLFACNGILFNHESPRRGETFVTRKISMAAARIKLGLQDSLILGNLDARRDWGFAGDYVRAMWQILQHDKPEDFVIATGETHSVSEFLEEAFGYLDLDWRHFVQVDPRYFRPTEIDLLHGDPANAREKLGWEPSLNFRDLVRLMIDSDLELVGRQAKKEAA